MWPRPRLPVARICHGPGSEMVLLLLFLDQKEGRRCPMLPSIKCKSASPVPAWPGAEGKRHPLLGALEGGGSGRGLARGEGNSVTFRL